MAAKVELLTTDFSRLTSSQSGLPRSEARTTYSIHLLADVHGLEEVAGDEEEVIAALLEDE